MTPGAIGTEIALMRVYEALRCTHRHDVETMLASIPQDPAAVRASDDERRQARAARATCRHCGRSIINEAGRWVDPLATGDDSVWRETCDQHDTFTAEHEPR